MPEQARETTTLENEFVITPKPKWQTSERATQRRLTLRNLFFVSLLRVVFLAADAMISRVHGGRHVDVVDNQRDATIGLFDRVVYIFEGNAGLLLSLPPWL